MKQTVYRSGHAYDWRGALFGRDREQTTLRESLHEMLEGRGRLVLIGGEAGIGKTALVQSLAQEAEEEGARVLTSACYDLMVTPPYGPWLELFSRFDEEDRPPLPVDADHHGAHRAASQDALFEEAYDSLVGAASQKPLVVVLEDLHWTDAASLEFLRYVARQLADLPLLVVVTYRDTELDRQHPLHQLMPVLVREAHATRIHLRPLPEDAVKALVNDYYGHGLSATDESRVVRYIQERAEGNPFFIGELLRTLEDKGYIAPAADGWDVADDLGQIPVPSLVRQVIEGRLARIDDESRRLLAIASVIGQDISLDVWQAASAATEDDLSAAITSATDLHLLEEAAGPAPLRFTHALIREALYYELGLPQRRALHQQVGEALASLPSPEPDAVAYHFREAGHDQAPRWLMAAGERAQQLYAWRTAAERFELVLPFLGTDTINAEARGWLLYRIGLLLIYADPDRGISHLTEAERVAGEIGDRHLAAYARADRGLLRCLVGDVRRGLDEMRAGVANLDTLPALEPTRTDTTVDSWLSVEDIQQGAFDLIGTSAEINIRRGALIFWLAWSGRYADTIVIGEPYVEQKPDAGAEMQDSLGDALAGLGHAYAALGRPDQALDAFAQARDAYQSIDHHFKVGNTAIYELSEAYLPYRADRVLGRQWLADQAEAG